MIPTKIIFIIDFHLISFGFFILAEFIDDIELMFSNCFEYNPRNTSEAKAELGFKHFSYSGSKTWLHVTSGNVDQEAHHRLQKSRI